MKNKKNLSSIEIVETYYNFLQKKGHKLLPNVSLIPENDPSLLYVNSGMFPLVDYLEGKEHPLGKRLMNIQRSLRFFEDVHNIGNDIRHTTAFHMMGNWSLGDYFKEEQLSWVFELFVEIFGMDPKRLFSTVFKGDESAPRDIESIEILQKIYKKYSVEGTVGDTKQIQENGKEDNWWKRGDGIGELGGADSEIFYYLGDESGIGKSVAKNQDDFVEIGNSVFMQYRKASENTWEELPQKNVDFGGGLERVAMVIQEQSDIFLTDNFRPVIEKIQEMSGLRYDKDFETMKAMRILADHARASTFLAMDGVVPSNKDQGYLLRRILRRMVVAGRKLNLNENISATLVETIISIPLLNLFYPDLQTKKEEIEEIFRIEEEKFSKTLDKGSRKVNEYINNLTIQDKIDEEEIAKQGFEFAQTLGYPIDIFIDTINELSIPMNTELVMEKYQDVFNKHQEISRRGMEDRFKK